MKTKKNLLTSIYDWWKRPSRHKKLEISLPLPPDAALRTDENRRNDTMNFNRDVTTYQVHCLYGTFLKR